MTLKAAQAGLSGQTAGVSSSGKSYLGTIQQSPNEGSGHCSFQPRWRDSASHLVQVRVRENFGGFTPFRSAVAPPYHPSFLSLDIPLDKAAWNVTVTCGSWGLLSWMLYFTQAITALNTCSSLRTFNSSLDMMSMSWLAGSSMNSSLSITWERQRKNEESKDKISEPFTTPALHGLTQ